MDVRNVRVCRPEASVSSVRTSSASASGAASRSVSQSPLRTSSPCGGGSCGSSKSSSLVKSSSSSSTNYASINTGLKSSFSSVSAGGGGGGGGFAIGGGGVTQTKDYFVKSNLGGGASKGAFGGGSSLTKTTTDFGSAERTRQYSATSMKQHEEAATIVTKVIREDTSIMEGKINELTDATAALQQNLGLLNEKLDNQSDDCNSVKGQLDNFVSITSEIKEVVQSLSVAMGEVKADVHSLHHSISACDQRIDGLESGFSSRFESLANGTGQMDNAIDQIRAEMADRAKLLEQQEAAMRYYKPACNICDNQAKGQTKRSVAFSSTTSCKGY